MKLKPLASGDLVQLCHFAEESTSTELEELDGLVSGFDKGLGLRELVMEGQCIFVYFCGEG